MVESPFAQLQQQAGNQAMQQLLRAGLIRAKLSISQPNDPEEREADATADRIMRSHAGVGVAATSCSCGTGDEEMCDECKQKQANQISRKASGGESESPSGAPRKVLDAVLRSPGHPLDASTRTFFEPRFVRDFSDVRVHTDSRAADSARNLNALAYATNEQIVFAHGQYSPASFQGQRLIAHELAHVARSQEGAASQTFNVLRQSDAGAPPPTPVSTDSGAAGGGSVIDRIRSAVTRPNPDPDGAGVGDFPEAFRVLNGLALYDMLNQLDALQATGEVEVLNGHISEAVGVGTDRIRTAMVTVRLAHSRAGATVRDVIDLVRGIQGLPPDQQPDVLNYVMRVKGAGVDRESLVALVTAIPATNEQPTTPPGAMSTANQPAVLASGAPALGGGGKPGGPPVRGGGGKGGVPAGGGGGGPRGPQPLHLRIGNLAHRLIASYYRSAHPGDVVFSNWYSVRRLVREIGDMKGVTYNVPAHANDRDWNTQPDITNLSRPHIYEIKPTALAGLAASEVAFYISMFAKAGVVMPPGPAGEPGTVGIVPIPPVGVFAFDSPSPGIILYGLRVRLNQQAIQQAQSGMSTAETVGVVILAVGLVAAAVLLTIFLPPVGVAVDEALAEGAALVGSGELALGSEAALQTGAVMGAETLPAATAAGAELSGEAMELKTLLDLELAGEAANDNALIDVALDEAAGF